MKLCLDGIAEKNAWESKGYHLPSYDVKSVKEKTDKSPAWVHFGAGNIFRAYHARLAQEMIENGLMDTGIVVAEGFDYEIIDKAYKPFDNLSILAILKSDGSVEKQVIGSVTASVKLDTAAADDFAYLRNAFENPSLQLATFTITEKGYSLKGPDGDYTKAVSEDMSNGPEKCVSYIGKVCSLLYARYAAGAFPIAMVSTDNCSHNGQKLYDAIHEFAVKWAEAGVADKGFRAYVEDPAKVSFPWSMIDKITPRPDDSVKDMIAADGVEDPEPVITGFHTYVAPFVNAEESEYLVIEDDFPGGRPALEKAGVIFTDRDTVNNVERMKVTTCLNPLHTSLAIYGCLLGFTRISEEMKDADLLKLIDTVGYKEGLPVVTDPGVVNPSEFIDTVVNKRLPNPFMPDTPQRIACDTSQKIPIRFGETIKSYIADAGRDVMDLNAIPLVIAGWLRYAKGIDDKGNAFECSPDPGLPAVQKSLECLAFGKEISFDEAKAVLDPILSDTELFAADLVKAGLSDRIVTYFISLMKSPGAVRETLHAALA
ncbi:MAG: mannitol dehydrogenase family protein [Lachnospiraceae bacterium]|nr:mannitol dehydrogenase family protein [Lachnospiraceae bacterium]